MKISIIMPVYNSGSYLSEAIDSVLKQSFNDFELILVDDGSIDGSSEKCDEYALKDPRIVVIHQENAGICNARNKALKIAKGEYIAFCDHDDVYLPELLNTVYRKAKEYDADIVKYGIYEETIWNGKPIKRRVLEYTEERFYDVNDISDSFMRMLLMGVFSFVWDGIYRRTYIERIGLIFDGYFRKGGEDMAYMLQLSQGRPSILTLNTVFYKHFIRIGFSSSSKIYKLRDDETFRVMHILDETIDHLCVDVISIKKDYTFFLVHFYINQMIGRYANPDYHFTRQEIYEKLNNMYYQRFLPNYFFEGSCYDIFKRSYKFGLTYYLFKHKMWWWLVEIYGIRLKYLKIKRKFIILL